MAAYSTVSMATCHDNLWQLVGLSVYPQQRTLFVHVQVICMCWGGVAGYGTHVLWWSSWLWYPCVGVE